MNLENGLAGNIAKGFIRSKLSVLLMIAFLLLGAFSVAFIPREEEPQIDVPMADIMVGYPGATPGEVETNLALPLEKIAANIKGVEDVYSTSMDGMAMITVQFYVGEDVERSLVKLYNELMKHIDRMPKGVTMPMVKSRAIDDVPALAYTLWSDSLSGYQLRQVAEVVANDLKKVHDVAQVNVIGGQQRQVKVLLDKEKMAAARVDFLGIAQMLQGSNMQMQSGRLLTADEAISVQTGGFFASADEIRQTIVGMTDGQPVYLHQVAQVEDGAEVPASYVAMGYGAARPELRGQYPGAYEAVTIALAKKQGADAMKLAEVVDHRVQKLMETIITHDIKVEQTRNYGATASQKVSELLMHLSVAILIVTLFVMMAMGWRGGLVVFLSVPVTFALTLFAYYFLDYTLNRITLFALVFVTGIVVDDSIIVAENMHRHFKMNNMPPLKAAICAINEVGNPTILATFTVIAAVLPMAFVSGMMGPYMSPMPIGASIAMLFSLLLALTLTPYFGFLFLRAKDKFGSADAEMPLEEEDNCYVVPRTRLYRIYEAAMRPFLESRAKRWAFMLGLTVVMFASFGLFYTKSVAVKMLPFDNKNEFQVMVDMPEGTTLERTAAVTAELAQYIGRQPLVTHYQSYVGASAPISFNGLVRHYDMRRGDNVADIQVNLVDKNERSEQSHDISKGMRAELQAIGRRLGANVKIVEVPPGPPVMSTIVAEIYGPDYEGQMAVARQVKDLLAKTDNVVDVDWSVEADQRELRLEVNKDKAMKHGVAAAQVAQTMYGALSGMHVGTLHQAGVENQVGIVLQLPEADRTTMADLQNLSVVNTHGVAVPLIDVVDVKESLKAKSISRKNQKRVVYVLAEVAGDLESPVYPITEVSERLKEVKLPKGYTLSEAYSAQPDYEDDYTVKWDGEWKITYEVFRDLGLAFAAVLIIIYILIVGWFQNFTTPLVQMTAVPLSLIGIVLGHWLLGAYFTATSMIGFIALAGIMVRNSVLLIDFINIRLEAGIPLRQAIVESGAVRTTPIFLTAGGVVLGAIVMLFDPIFQGLAIALIGGSLSSTILTLIVVPLLYYKAKRSTYESQLL